jgi:hypothetical protein
LSKKKKKGNKKRTRRRRRKVPHRLTVSGLYSRRRITDSVFLGLFLSGRPLESPFPTY